MQKTRRMVPGVRIQVAAPGAIEAVKADLVHVYRQAFRHPPYVKSEAEVAEFARFLPLHASAPGFRLVLALAADTGKAVGFAYGRTATKGQPWYAAVAGPLRAAGLGEWLADAFQFTEFAVLPDVQRQGIGSRLHDRLLQGLAHKRAVLTTIAAAGAASRFYAGKGWRVLLPELIVPDYPRTYRVMGRELPLIEERAP